MIPFVKIPEKIQQNRADCFVSQFLVKLEKGHLPAALDCIIEAQESTESLEPTLVAEMLRHYKNEEVWQHERQKEIDKEIYEGIFFPSSITA